MSDRETHGNTHTEIEVTDFGPIVRGKVTLRPLTVFVGPSNTGKSYLATLIYALHRHFSAGRFDEAGKPFLTFKRIHIAFGGDDKPRSTLTPHKVAPFEEAVRSASASSAQGAIDISLSDSMARILHTEFGQDVWDIGQELNRSFGVERVAKLIRHGRGNPAGIVLRRPPCNNRQSIEHNIGLRRGKFPGPRESFDYRVEPGNIDYSVEGMAGTPMRVDGKMQAAWRALLRPYKSEQDSLEAYRDAVDMAYESALPGVAAPFHVRAHYLPAGRAGAMHTLRVVIRALLSGATRADIAPKMRRKPTMPGVWADFLDELLSINRPSNRPPFRMRKKNRRDWGADIEESMLGGKIEMEPDEVTGYPHFFYRPAHWKRGRNLPLMNASSMISELAPVVLYLRHAVEHGEVLVVEEPEAHLHPAMQAEFMRQLIGCVRAGIRIIVTTHSEWLIEELANAVKRSEIPEKQRKILPNGNAALPPDKVGVHLFRPSKRPRGSIVNEVSPDERGLYRTGFDDVAMSTHNQWADIASLIGRGK